MNKLAYAALLIGLTASVSTDVFAAPAKKAAPKGRIVGQMGPDQIPGDIAQIDTDIATATANLGSVQADLKSISSDLSGLVSGYTTALSPLDATKLFCDGNSASYCTTFLPLYANATQASTNANAALSAMTATIGDSETAVAGLQASLTAEQTKLDTAMGAMSTALKDVDTLVNCATLSSACVQEQGNGVSCTTFTSQCATLPSVPETASF